tara:strand:- start:2322 stop:4049 length:1728 start_codon:yes stop_codon:yes gene_type:complete
MKKNKIKIENIEVEVGRVDENSTTNELNITLNAESFVEENSRTKTVLTFDDGSQEIGLGRIGLFQTEWRENDLEFKNQINILWSRGFDSNEGIDRTITKAVNALSLVYKVDKNGNKLPSESATFSVPPPLNTSIKKFDGLDQHVLENSPFPSVKFGVDFSDSTPNQNYISGSDIRLEGRIKAIIGPQGSGKTQLIKQIIEQHLPFNIGLFAIDQKGDFCQNSSSEFNLKKLAEAEGRIYKEFSSFDIIEKPTISNIKRVAKECTLYKTAAIISLGSQINEDFVDYFLEQLEKKQIFVEEKPIFDVVKLVLEDLSSKENLFLNSKYSKTASADEKKKKIKELLSNEFALARLVRKVEKVQRRFLRGEGKYTAEEIVEDFLNTQRAIFVLNSESHTNNHYVEQVRFLSAASNIFEAYYQVLDSDKKMRNHGFLIDEFQMIAPRKNDVETQLGKLRKKSIETLSGIFSKQRSYGAFAWVGFPSQKLVDHQIVDLISAHEIYLGSNLSQSDCDKFLGGISTHVLEQYKIMPLPKKVRQNGVLVLDNFHFLLSGEQSPFEPGNNGHIVKFVIDNEKKKNV